MVCNNILEAIGQTPMICLSKMGDSESARILVKFEGLNVGGSIKTRTAYNMVIEAEKMGKINKDTIIVEPTSGNQGIGLALVGAVKGYKTKIIMPDSVSEERRKLVQHYGAEVILVHDYGNIGECIEQCLQTALKMQKEDPNVFVPQQFENPANPSIQRSATAAEILRQVDGPIHGFCSGIGTGGTLLRHHCQGACRALFQDLSLPLCITSFVCFYNLRCKTHVARTTLGALVVHIYGLSEARRFTESDIAGNNSFVKLWTIVLFDLSCHLRGKICSGIIHGKKHSLKLQITVEVSFYLPYG